MHVSPARAVPGTLLVLGRPRLLSTSACRSQHQGLLVNSTPPAPDSPAANAVEALPKRLRHKPFNKQAYESLIEVLTWCTSESDEELLLDI